MIENKITINKPNGVDARVAAIFTHEAGKFLSNVWLLKDSTEVNGKSIMGIISLALAKGDDIMLRVEGIDEEKCLKKLRGILEEDSNE